MYKKTILALAVAALSASVSAETPASKFILVAPVISVAEAAKDISIALSGSNLPAAVTGQAYRFDLNNLLKITGDPSAASNYVAWSVKEGSLPEGLSMTRGLITGTPINHGDSAFTIQAHYKTKTGEQTYAIAVALKISLASSPMVNLVKGLPMTPVDLKPLLSSLSKGFDVRNASWAVAPGSELPEGVVISSAGVISGTPLQAFDKAVRIQAKIDGAEGEQLYQFLAQDIKVAIATQAPQAWVNEPYEVAVNELVRVTGDRNYSAEERSVEVSPNSWLKLNSEVLKGTPGSVSEDSSITLTANYKGITESTNVKVPIKARITNVNGVRQWSDGTAAASCKEYLAGSTTHAYAGATGSGAYKLQAGSGEIFTATCDMDSDGGGWTLAFNNVGALMSTAHTGDGTTCDPNLGTSTCFGMAYHLVPITDGLRVFGANSYALTADAQPQVVFKANASKINGSTAKTLFNGGLGNDVTLPHAGHYVVGDGLIAFTGDTPSSIAQKYDLLIRDTNNTNAVLHFIAAGPLSWGNSCGALMNPYNTRCNNFNHWPTQVKVWVR